MRPAILALVFAAASPAWAQGVPTRGELLYATHCVECHSTRMHWREQRLARDWTTLKYQVRRWQGEARLQWSEADIEAVTRHLNDSIYHFAPPRPQARAQAAPAPR